MTTLEASQILLKWFSNNHAFELSRDYSKLLIVTDQPIDSVHCAILLSLEDFERTGVIKSKEIGSKTNIKKHWILVKPFSNYDQSIVLDLNLCIKISDTINNYCKMINTQEYLSEPLNIKKSDIEKLVCVSEFLLNLADRENIKT